MATPLDYNVNSIVKGTNGFGRKPPKAGFKYTVTLAAATLKTLAVPSSTSVGTISSTSTNMFLAVFSYQPATRFWVAINAAAAVPAGGDFAASTSELLPSAYVLAAGDVIQVISASGGDMGVSFYAIPDA